MLKIGIVGCGKIADDHCSQIRRIKDCEIVAACDREVLMAKQLSERFMIKSCFGDLTSFLREAKADVVHVCTSPEGHFEVALECLKTGHHVYVEKPFTLYEWQARHLIAVAEEKKLKITVGHDDQFRHGARRMRALIREGFLGGGPVHMESFYCYELSSSGYAQALLGNRQHWARRLPGGLLQNVISHGIARIAEFLAGDSFEVVARGFSSPFLRAMGENEIIDELRVIITDAASTTAYFTFSSQMRPSLHQFQVYGRKNGLIVDQDQETLIRLRGARRKSYLEKFVSPAQLAMQYLHNVRANLARFVGNDFHMKSGMKYLIEAFYSSIVQGADDPIPHREILLTAQIMDQIFAQLRDQRKPNCLLGDQTLHPALSE